MGRAMDEVLRQISRSTMAQSPRPSLCATQHLLVATIVIVRLNTCLSLGKCDSIYRLKDKFNALLPLMGKQLTF